jgi:hypothetical protein
MSLQLGILTFHNGPNYGAFLQAWHLRKAIETLGHDVTVVNYQNPVHAAWEKNRIMGLSLQSLSNYLKRRAKEAPFPPYVKQLCRHPFTTSATDVPWDEFDTLVVGSDVVWDFSNPHYGHESAFFGEHSGQRNLRMIAYAPSCGKTLADSHCPAYVSKGISRFTFAGVRDPNTQDLVRRLTGRDVPLVVDPTWLQEDLAESQIVTAEKPYLLLYGGGLVEAGRAKVLRDFCSKQGWSLISASTNTAVADRVYRRLTPWEWVGLFAGANAVVTSTLHGLLYAVKYHKPLIFMENENSALKSREVIARCALSESLVRSGVPFTTSLLRGRLIETTPPEAPKDWISQSKERLRLALAINPSNSNG